MSYMMMQEYAKEYHRDLINRANEERMMKKIGEQNNNQIDLDLNLRLMQNIVRRLKRAVLKPKAELQAKPTTWL